MLRERDELVFFPFEQKHAHSFGLTPPPPEKNMLIRCGLSFWFKPPTLLAAGGLSLPVGNLCVPLT